MKKLLCLALALCLMLTLFACSGKTETPSGDDKTSAPTNSEPSGETEELADIADFEGTWKLGSPLVACYTVNATDKTVTAYAANGIAIGTFPVVATTEGIVLKMGGFGIVPLNDPTALTITTVPTVSSYDLVGEYEMIYGEYLGATLSIADDKNWTLAGESYAKGFEGVVYKSAIKQTDTLLEVSSGTADFAVLDAQLAESYVGKGDYANLKVIDALTSDVEYYAIGFKKGSDLTLKVNAELEKLLESGEIQALAVKYGVENTTLKSYADQK